jgi:hypothetical protein
MLVSVKFEIGMVCPKCKTKYPLQGPHSNPQCYSCKTKVTIPRFDLFVLVRDAINRALAFPDDEKVYRGTTFIPEQYKYTRAHCQAPPSCLSCQLPFPEEQIRAAESELECNSCKEVMPIRANDKALEKLVDKAFTLWVLNDPGEQVEVKEKPVAKKLMFACMTCQSALEVDGSERTVKCSFCSNKNYLPLDVWTFVNAVPTTHPFTVVVDATEERILQAKIYCLYSRGMGELPDESPFYLSHSYDDVKFTRKLEQEIAAIIVKQEPTEWLKHTKSRNPGVRKALAQMEETSDELQQLLVKDENVLVRIQLATASNLPISIAKSLLKDKRHEVREALAKNEKTDPKVMLLLTADDDWEVRIALAGNANVSRPALKKLRRDEDSYVKEKARSNANYAPGFWDRLFGW